MYHSITFGDKNTWDDWHLVPSSRPVFNPPTPKTKTIDIPGGDGVIDLSLALTGYPIYKNRTGSFEFIVPNGFEPWEAGEIEKKPWYTIYSEIMDYLHGQSMRAILEDDPEYFYEGRFTVNSWKSDKDWSKITINYDVGPYKWDILSSTEDWLWDPFNFQNGVIRSSIFKNIAVSSDVKTLSFEADYFGRAPICPTFFVRTTMGRGVYIHFVNPRLGLDMTKLVTDGSVQIPEFVFFGDQGATVDMWCDSETGTVSIDFRQGRL